MPESQTDSRSGPLVAVALVAVPVALVAAIVIAGIALLDGSPGGAAPAADADSVQRSADPDPVARARAGAGASVREGVERGGGGLATETAPARDLAEAFEAVAASSTGVEQAKARVAATYVSEIQTLADAYAAASAPVTNVHPGELAAPEALFDLAEGWRTMREANRALLDRYERSETILSERLAAAGVPEIEILRLLAEQEATFPPEQVALRRSDDRIAGAMIETCGFLAEHAGRWGWTPEEGYRFDRDVDDAEFQLLQTAIERELELQAELSRRIVEHYDRLEAEAGSGGPG